MAKLNKYLFAGEGITVTDEKNDRQAILGVKFQNPNPKFQTSNLCTPGRSLGFGIWNLDFLLLYNLYIKYN